MTEEQFYQMLGQKFKALREKSGLNLSQLARKLGVKRALLYQFEEKGKKISAFRINQLLTVFGVSTIEDLVDSEKKTLSTSTSPCQPVMA